MASGGREIIEDISRVSCSLNYFISSLRVSFYLNIAVWKEGSIVDFRKEMFGTFLFWQTSRMESR